jgi:hypothetical protein
VNGYFDRLGDELRLATELRYGRHSTDPGSLELSARSRLSRWRDRLVRFGSGRVGGWPRLGVLAILAASATAAAAAIPLLDRSDGLAGAVPQAALTSPGRLPGPLAEVLPHRLPDGLRYAIPVAPDLEAGHAGWCSGPEFALPGARARFLGGGGACAPAMAHSVAIVAGGAALTNVLQSLSAPHPARADGALSDASVQRAIRRAVWLNWFVVSDRVAVIRVGATSFLPERDPELARDWRAVVTFTRGLPTTFRFLDRRGRPINQPAQPPVPSVPVTTVNPHHLPAAVCSLGSSHLPGIGGEWEVVADAAPRRGPLVDPDVLFSCARAWYAFPRTHAVYSAAILLNAQNPARPAPNLPGLTPSIRPGDYEEAAATAGQTTARRIGNAWLLVQGPNQQRRAALLQNIVVAGTAIHH